MEIKKKNLMFRIQKNFKKYKQRTNEKQKLREKKKILDKFLVSLFLASCLVVSMFPTFWEAGEKQKISKKYNDNIYIKKKYCKRWNEAWRDEPTIVDRFQSGITKMKRRLV